MVRELLSWQAGGLPDEAAVMQEDTPDPGLLERLSSAVGDISNLGLPGLAVLFALIAIGLLLVLYKVVAGRPGQERSRRPIGVTTNVTRRKIQAAKEQARIDWEQEKNIDINATELARLREDVDRVLDHLNLPRR